MSELVIFAPLAPEGEDVFVIRLNALWLPSKFFPGCRNGMITKSWSSLKSNKSQFRLSSSTETQTQTSG
jgi:hypothetical protein